MTRERAVTYWLLPRSEDAARYKAVIQNLAGASGGRVFEPHLTLGTLHERASNLSSVISNLKALTLSPLEIDGTDVFTTSLFLRFKPSDAVLAARSAFETLDGFRSGRTFDPHISLHYGAPPRDARARSDVQQLLKAQVTFDRLVAVSVELPITRLEDLDAWRVLDSFELSPT